MQEDIAIIPGFMISFLKIDIEQKCPWPPQK